MSLKMWSIGAAVAAVGVPAYLVLAPNLVPSGPADPRPSVESPPISSRQTPGPSPVSSIGEGPDIATTAEGGSQAPVSAEKPGKGPEVGDAPEAAPIPAIASPTAGVLAAEQPPLLDAANQPLTLAQVLAPGEAPASDQIAPRFDLVRVAPDGSTVIAGRAAPGANVQVFAGETPVASAVANAQGAFVAFLESPAAPALDLRIPDRPEGTQLVVSQDDIIILPAAPDTENQAPTVLHRTADAVEIIQPAGLAIPGNISLDMVSYAQSGAVQLAGRGRPGNVARVYADGRLAGEAVITDGGNWALEISDIAEGRYVLRVDEVSPGGKVVSRTESPFQRQFPEADSPETFSQGAKIIVQPGNTLWLMAAEAYGDGEAYSQIFAANKDSIRDPDLIYPGQIFSIPRIGE